jgi:hypothetical protein
MTWLGRLFPTVGSAVTVGNSIIAGPGVLAGAKWTVPGTTIMDHELSHIRQSPFEGPGYIPLNAALLILFGHKYNIFERWWIDVPNY